MSFSNSLENSLDAETVASTELHHNEITEPFQQHTTNAAQPSLETTTTTQNPSTPTTEEMSRYTFSGSELVLWRQTLDKNFAIHAALVTVNGKSTWILKSVNGVAVTNLVIESVAATSSLSELAREHDVPDTDAFNRILQKSYTVVLKLKEMSTKESLQAAASSLGKKVELKTHGPRLFSLHRPDTTVPWNTSIDLKKCMLGKVMDKRVVPNQIIEVNGTPLVHAPENALKQALQGLSIVLKVANPLKAIK